MLMFTDPGHGGLRPRPVVCYGPAAPFIAIAATVVGTAVSAYGAIQQGNAAKEAANYQAQVANNNAITANNNAIAAEQAGAVQAEQKQMQTGQTIGKIIASKAASGLDVNSGSSADLVASTADVGELDSETIRNNADKTAYGYRTQGQSYTAQAELDQMQGDNAAAAGQIGAVSSLLSGASSVSSKWMALNPPAASSSPTGLRIPGGI
jgi:hypothetical protein